MRSVFQKNLTIFRYHFLSFVLAFEFILRRDTCKLLFGPGLSIVYCLLVTLTARLFLLSSALSYVIVLILFRCTIHSSHPIWLLNWFFSILLADIISSIYGFRIWRETLYAIRPRRRSIKQRNTHCTTSSFRILGAINSAHLLRPKWDWNKRWTRVSNTFAARLHKSAVSDSATKELHNALLILYKILHSWSLSPFQECVVFMWWTYILWSRYKLAAWIPVSIAWTIQYCRNLHHPWFRVNVEIWRSA